jgi:hypothetical protein
VRRFVYTFTGLGTETDVRHSQQQHRIEQHDEGALFAILGDALLESLLRGVLANTVTMEFVLLR